MIELRTLGTIDLVGADEDRLETLLRRPKRLALLAYLAIERPTGHQRRDTLLAMFWPEADDVHARAALRQALHVIRGALGDSAVHAVGDEQLSLSPAALRCDAVEFDQAAVAGDLARALGLYQGDLLPGLFIDGAAAFDQWLDGTRQRLRGVALRVAGDLADKALAAGDLVAALDAARRAVTIAPDDEPASRRLIAVLDRRGDRAGALAAYDTLARRMTEHFDSVPSAESRALALAVRSREHADPRALGPRAADTPTVAANQVARRRVRWRRPKSLLVACGLLTIPLTGSRAPAISGDNTASIKRIISPGARDAYERGRHYLDKRGEVNLRLAVRYFEQARDSEPLYAAAYAGLGDSYLQLGYGNYLSPVEAFPKAIEAANRAIKLDSLLPDAYATLGFARMYYDWNWVAAERAFRRAIALDSTYAPAHQRYAYLLAVNGRFNDARAEIDRAKRLDPLSQSIATDVGFVLFYTGQFRAARVELREVLARDSLSPVAHLWLGRVNQGEGKLDAALREYASTGPLRQWGPTIAAVGVVHGQRGDRPQAMRALALLDSISRDRYVTAYAFGLVYAAVGERDSAFVWLDSAVAERTHWLVWLALDQRWAPLRADPRFAKLLERVGLKLERPT
jgi:DNA-binding SARP family transcriptional activator/Tfp pilus assembly protein PilF